jgi:DNA-binding CsgD family transcriptional regulator
VHAGLHQLVWPLLHHIDVLPDVQAAALRGAIGNSEATSDRLPVGAALLTLLSHVAHERPLLVLVDDAHWLDEASADALTFAARRLANQPVAIVFASTVDATRDFRIPGLQELPLHRLTRESAVELLNAMHDDLTPLVRQRLIDESEGNPLALIELSQALSTDERRGRDRLPHQLSLSTRLRELYSERLGSLPQDTQDLLLVAAAEPSGDVSIVLEAISAMGIAVEAIRPAEESHVVAINDRRIRFCHPIERSAIYAGATFDKRIAAHWALAQVADADDRRAWHLAATAVGHDEELARSLELSAAQTRARRGPAVAAVALERAADLSMNESDRSRRLVSAARSALDAGHFTRAHALLDDAERMRPEFEVHSDMAYARGVGQLQSAPIWFAPAPLIRAAAVVSPADPEQAASMLAVAAHAAWLADDEPWLDEVWKAIVRLPLSGGSLMKRVAMSSAGPTMRRSVDLPGGLFQAALEAADRMPPSLWSWPSPAAASTAGELFTAQRLYRRLTVKLSTTGIIGQLTAAWAALASIELHLGRWPDAVMHASEVLRFRETGDVVSSARALSVLSRIAGAQGREGESRRLAIEAIRLASDHGSQSIVAGAAGSLGALEMGGGRYEEAFIQFQTAARADTWPDGKLSAATWAADLAAASVQTGRLEIASRVVEAMERWVHGHAPPWAMVAAHRSRALLSKGDQALTEFDAAVSVAGDVDAFALAQTQLEYGEALRRLRYKTEARRQLRAGLEVFTELGAKPWMERAQAELRATGVSVASRQGTPTDHLTPQELQIARLCAVGMSNREIGGKLFLSPRTVGFHLSNVFGKLGVASRGELRGMRLGDDMTDLIPSLTGHPADFNLGMRQAT